MLNAWDNKWFEFSFEATDAADLIEIFKLWIFAKN